MTLLPDERFEILIRHGPRQVELDLNQGDYIVYEVDGEATPSSKRIYRHELNNFPAKERVSILNPSGNTAFLRWDMKEIDHEHYRARGER